MTSLQHKAATLETVQDFLIKLSIKPCMHILKISIFSLNQVIVRPTKIMNKFLRDFFPITSDSLGSFWTPFPPT